MQFRGIVIVAFAVIESPTPVFLIFSQILDQLTRIKQRHHLVLCQYLDLCYFTFYRPGQGSDRIQSPVLVHVFTLSTHTSLMKVERSMKNTH